MTHASTAGPTAQAAPVSVVEPALALPPYLAHQEEVMSALARHFADMPHLDRGLSLMRHTTVRTRPVLVPVEELLKDTSFGERNARYKQEAVELGARAARGALANAGITGEDIDYLVVVSCTGYMLPGPDAYIAQEIGCRPTVRRTPIQQMGCAAGVSALAEAFHFVRAYPDAQALVVAVELSSLSFQRDHGSLSDFISAAIFSDGAAAAVVRQGRDDPGFQIVDALQHLLPASTDVISGDTTEIGFHFQTDPRVRRTVAHVVPALTALVERQGWHLDDLDFCVSHTGGPLVMDGVEQGLRLAPGTLRPSRDSLAEVGNPSSVSVYDVLRRHHGRPPADGSRGLMVAFGPGFTTEALAGTWRGPSTVSRTDPSTAATSATDAPGTGVRAAVVDID